MLDPNDFIAERGGDPKKIKESQRRRYVPESIVDDVIALHEDHKKSRMFWTPSGCSALINAPTSKILGNSNRKPDQCYAEGNRPEEKSS